MTNPAVGAIIVAAGSSKRMAGLDKLWLDLEGQPILARTIAAVSATPGLAQLVVAAGSETLTRVRPLASQAPWSAVHRWVKGGETRQDSVYHALRTLDPCDVVLIHDGARPLVSTDLLARAVAAAIAHGAAIAAIPVTDTIKVIDDADRIAGTLDRSALRAAQTPQAFLDPVIRAAYRAVGSARATCTDDGAVAERGGSAVYVFPGERENIKVSTREDIALVRALWSARRQAS